MPMADTPIKKKERFINEFFGAAFFDLPVAGFKSVFSLLLF
jgi:hypothetical protein